MYQAGCQPWGGSIRALGRLYTGLGAALYGPWGGSIRALGRLYTGLGAALYGPWNGSDTWPDTQVDTRPSTSFLFGLIYVSAQLQLEHACHI